MNLSSELSAIAPASNTCNFASIPSLLNAATVQCRYCSTPSLFNTVTVQHRHHQAQPSRGQPVEGTAYGRNSL